MGKKSDHDYELCPFGVCRCEAVPAVLGNQASDSQLTKKELKMSRTPRRKLPTKPNPSQPQRKLVRPEPTTANEDRAGGVMRTLYPASPRAGMAKRKKLEAGGEHAATPGPSVPDLFDVVTYFRARGDSYALIANIGFWMGEDRTKVLTAKGLKLWYEGELDRRAAVKATNRQRSRLSS
jgi:hypothetical protein